MDKRTGKLVSPCKDCRWVKQRDYIKSNPEQRREISARSNRKQYAARRKAVLDHYGRACSCCGESEEVFLTIDHVNDDGAEHRKEIGGTSPFYRWLISNTFPLQFQTLCWNCNWAKAHGGCPHRLDKPSRT